jgi:hypothetical protein
MFTFSKALKKMKEGLKVQRSIWNNNCYLYLTYIDIPFPSISNGKFWENGSLEETKIIVMKTSNNNLIPWTINQEDLLLEDWKLVSEPSSE